MNKSNSLALLSLIMAGGFPAFNDGLDIYEKTGEVFPKQKELKTCLLPGCEKKCKGNFIYCCPEHLKEHKQIKMK